MKKKITPEDQRILQRKFPKFTKITACYCNNPAYGVSLSPEAKRWLNRSKNEVKTKPKTKVISARVDEERAKLISECAAQRGITVNELINETIGFLIDPYHELEEEVESTMCKGLSRQDGNMQENLRET